MLYEAISYSRFKVLLRYDNNIEVYMSECLISCTCLSMIKEQSYAVTSESFMKQLYNRVYTLIHDIVDSYIIYC